jgi:hypothetical protein
MKRIAKICLFAIFEMAVGCSPSSPQNSVCEAEKAQVEKGGNQSERLPLGLAKMPDSKMRGSVIFGGSPNAAGVTISAEMDVPGNLKDIGRFYKNEFARLNAKIDIPEYYDDLILLHGPTADGGYLMIGVDTRRQTGVRLGSAKVDFHYQASCL